MSAGKTILILSRGARLNYLFRAMAKELGGRHRVIVLAFPDERGLYDGLEGVEVRALESWDVAFPWRNQPDVALPALRSRAQSIEQALGVPLYKIAGDYLLHGRVVRSYGGPWPYLNTEADCLLAFTESFDTLSAAFEECKPHVVFYESVDLISTYVALTLARRRGIFALEMSPAVVGGAVWPSYGARRVSIVLQHLYANRALIRDDSYVKAEAILADPRAALYATPYAVFNKSTLNAGSPFRARRLAKAIQRPRHLTEGLRNIRWYVRLARHRRWLDRRLARSLTAPASAGFPLSHLPEASTCSQAPRWVDQNAIVEQLALNAPAGLTIAVKEHPRSYGRRGPDFFEPLMRLPNVTVCHPSVSNYELLAGAEAVLATTGSSGFEGIVLGKKVGVLGRPYYAVYTGVKRLTHPEDLLEALADQTWRPEDLHEERRHFLAAYAQSLCDFGLDRTGEYPSHGGTKWAIALEMAMDFIDEHGLTPLQFDAGLGPLR